MAEAVLTPGQRVLGAVRQGAGAPLFLLALLAMVVIPLPTPITRTRPPTISLPGKCRRTGLCGNPSDGLSERSWDAEAGEAGVFSSSVADAPAPVSAPVPAPFGASEFSSVSSVLKRSQRAFQSSSARDSDGDSAD